MLLDGGIVALEMAMRHPSTAIRLAATGANIRSDSTALLPSIWLDEKHLYELHKTTYAPPLSSVTIGSYF